MSAFSRAFVPLIGAVVAAAGITVSSGAVASATTEPAQATTHCATVVSDQLDQNGNSVVVGPMRCSSTSQDALAQSRKSTASTNGAASTQAYTLLLTEYKDAGYGGGVLYDYYGTAGPCDSAGYHLVNYVQVELSVSSMQGFNNCNFVRINDEQFHYGTFGLPLYYVGDEWNDDLVALQVYHG